VDFATLKGIQPERDVETVGAEPFADPRLTDARMRQAQNDEQMQAVFGRMGQMDAPEQVLPAFRTPDAIALGLALLLGGGGREIAPTLAGFLGAKQNQAAADTQARVNRFEGQSRAGEQQLRALSLKDATLQRETSDILDDILRRDQARERDVLARDRMDQLSQQNRIREVNRQLSVFAPQMANPNAQVRMNAASAVQQIYQQNADILPDVQINAQALGIPGYQEVLAMANKGLTEERTRSLAQQTDFAKRMEGVNKELGLSKIGLNKAQSAALAALTPGRVEEVKARAEQLRQSALNLAGRTSLLQPEFALEVYRAQLSANRLQAEVTLRQEGVGKGVQTQQARVYGTMLTDANRQLGSTQSTIRMLQAKIKGLKASDPEEKTEEVKQARAMLGELYAARDSLIEAKKQAEKNFQMKVAPVAGASRATRKVSGTITPLPIVGEIDFRNITPLRIPAPPSPAKRPTPKRKPQSGAPKTSRSFSDLFRVDNN
jgi:hypothetical protein